MDGSGSWVGCGVCRLDQAISSRGVSASSGTGGVLGSWAWTTEATASARLPARIALRNLEFPQRSRGNFCPLWRGISIMAARHAFKGNTDSQPAPLLPATGGAVHNLFPVGSLREIEAL